MHSLRAAGQSRDTAAATSYSPGRVGEKFDRLTDHRMRRMIRLRAIVAETKYRNAPLANFVT